MHEYANLLRKMIAIPSVSGDEAGATSLIRSFLSDREVPYNILHNNTWAVNLHFDALKPNLLFNSHVDTVKPVPAWSCDPFGAVLEGDRITGLGSNDAGGPLVTLLAVFMHLYARTDLPYNLIFAATAEEETSGPKGFSSIVPELPEIALAIVGEPTRMELAVAEKGLLVLDCVARGVSGHAAREEGVNAIHRAIDDITALRQLTFDKVSPVLGPVKLTVTQIEAGTQHNVVPDSCRFVVDVRTNEYYSNEAVFSMISAAVNAEVTPRSLRLNSSGLPENHPLVDRAKLMGVSCYGSPTTSDQAVMPWPSVKIGPGDSARSHTADEYIYISEMTNGFELYLNLIDQLKI